MIWIAWSTRLTGYEARLRGLHIDIAPAEQFLERHTLGGRVGMQWEVYPVDMDIEIPLQLFNTPGTEIAPWSNVIAEYFQRDRLSHPPLLESRRVVARQFYQCFRTTRRVGAAFASIRFDSNTGDSVITYDREAGARRLRHACAPRVRG